MEQVWVAGPYVVIVTAAVVAAEDMSTMTSLVGAEQELNGMQRKHRGSA